MFVCYCCSSVCMKCFTGLLVLALHYWFYYDGKHQNRWNRQQMLQHYTYCWLLLSGWAPRQTTQYILEHCITGSYWYDGKHQNKQTKPQMLQHCTVGYCAPQQTTQHVLEHYITGSYWYDCKHQNKQTKPQMLQHRTVGYFCFCCTTTNHTTCFRGLHYWFIFVWW